jgi:glycosyltransferase involved in cell wall biosynthesis
MTADAVGGVWTYATELAGALACHGFSTTLATMGPPPSADQLAACRTIAGLEIETGDFQLEWMEDPWRDVERAGRWLLDLESRINPCIVHLNGYAHAALPWRTRVLVVGHSCVVSWAEAVGERIDPQRLDRYRRAITAGLRNAGWVVAPSHAMLAALQRAYGPLPRASVVPNGRNAALFRRGEKAPLVFSAGRLWDRAKNVETLAAIRGRVSWPVVIGGTETMEGAGRLSQADIASWLARAAIVAMPARYEPFGLLPLEAALSGCALVLGDIPSLREVWGDAAVFVAPEDRDALARAIERLIHSAAERQAAADRAHARALTYTPARMAEAYVRLYRSPWSLPCAS